MSPLPVRLRVVVALLGILAAAAGCGKKGPPLAPIVRVPAGVQRLDARRVGSDIYITVTIPAKNVDDSTPADIAKVEVYGYTGRTAPPRPRWVELGSVVATIPVAPPPAPAGRNGSAGSTEVAEADRGARQGGTVTIRDTLTPDELSPVAVPASLPVARVPPTITVAGPAAEAPIRRFYLAIPYSPRGRPGPPGVEAELTLAPLPDAPRAVQLTYTETSVTLEWETSGGLIGYLFERPLLAEPNPEGFDAVPETSRATENQGTWTGPARYNVYMVPSPGAPTLGPDVPPPPTWQAVPDAPLNSEPLAATSFSGPVVFGGERCYAVRAVRSAGTAVVESELSLPACVVAVDYFPPAAPSALAAVAAEGAISLIWEPNREPDLGGYMVLRGAAGDATLQPLTRTPLSEARFRDTTVTPGTRYVYAVVALDKRALLPNVSAESNRVEETAR